MAQTNTVFPNGVESGARSLENVTVTTKASAAAVTYTATEFVGGFILRDPSGGARTDVTPTATQIIAELGTHPRPVDGASFIVTIRNTADAAETITMSGGTGVTISGTATIAQNNQKSFLLVKTGDDTFTMYSLGTVTY